MHQSGAQFFLDGLFGTINHTAGYMIWQIKATASRIWKTISVQGFRSVGVKQAGKSVDTTNEGNFNS